MRSIEEMMTKSYAQMFGDYLSDIKDKDWYFHGIWQKLLLIFCFFFTVGSIVFYLWRAIAS